MNKNMHTTLSEQATLIIYDGECPFCNSFVRMTRLRSSLGEIQLIDARQGGEVVNAIQIAKLDLDQGMVLVYQGYLYHGAECLHMIALLSSTSIIFNRIFARLFRSRAFCRLSYPLMRSGRNLILKIKGSSKLTTTK